MLLCCHFILSHGLSNGLLERNYIKGFKSLSPVPQWDDSLKTEPNRAKANIVGQFRKGKIKFENRLGLWRVTLQEKFPSLGDSWAVALGYYQFLYSKKSLLLTNPKLKHCIFQYLHIDKYLI